MFSWLRNLVASPAPGNATPEHLKLKAAHKDIPRYPPFMKGLPTHTPEELLETQADLLLALQQSCDATRSEFEKFYRASIVRFAAFVHLLPASQAHHHRGAGGLLRHSLEVGLWALREADKMPLIGLTKTPGRKGIIVPRWQLTAFLAGLCHDVGKPMTDVSVRNHTATSHWKPVKETLWAWADRQRVDAYFLEWQESRARRHVALTAAMAKHVITDSEMEWIDEGDPQLLGWLMETLNGTPSNTNPLYDIVVRADQKSVERDLKSIGAAMAGYDLGVPVERVLIDTMHSMVRQGVWLVNEPGAKIWCLDGTVFAVWPTAGQDLATEVHRDNIPGVPRSADAILDMLLERQLAFMNGDDFYKIAPSVLAKKIPDIKLNCIRLRDDTLVSKLPLASIDGVVLNAKKASVPAPDDQQAAVSVAPSEPGQTSAAPNPVQAQKAIPTSLEQVAQAAPREESEQPSQPKRERAVKQKSQPSTRSAPQAGQESVDGNRSSPPARELPGPGPGPATATATATREPTESKQPSEVVQLSGALGEALKALAEDLNVGDKQWGEHAFIGDDGRLLLAWPAAFAGYGLSPSSIIAEFTERNWCSADPNFPTRRVIEVEIEGAQIRAMRLHHDVSQTLLQICGTTGEAAKNKTAPPPKPELPATQVAPTAKTSVATETPPAPTSASSSPPKKKRKKDAPAAGHIAPKHSSPENLVPKTAEPNSTAPVQPSLPAPEEVARQEFTLVMKALASLQAPPQEDGWSAAPLKDALAAILEQTGKTYGRAGLYSLATANRDRLKLSNGKLLFKPS